MGSRHGFAVAIAAIELVTSIVSCTFVDCIMSGVGSLSTSTTALLWIPTLFLFVGPLCAVSLLFSVGGVGGGVLADSRHTSSLGYFGRSDGSTDSID